MQVLVNSVGGGDLTERVQGLIEGRLERFAGRIARVEVQLDDLNSRQLGERDKRCLMEARLGGMRPVAVSHEASTLTEAIHVATDKLERAVEYALERVEDLPGPAPSEAHVAPIEVICELQPTAADRK
ncbi:MAG: HPF/RaiA family ribosome-associated protein [Steroidobacteraceae bacterium]